MAAAASLPFASPSTALVLRRTPPLVEALDDRLDVEQARDLLARAADTARLGQLYGQAITELQWARQHRAGREACDAAGEIAVRAAAALAVLYTQEKDARGGDQRSEDRIARPCGSVGKEALARDYGVSSSLLRKWRPLAAAAAEKKLDELITRVREREYQSESDAGGSRPRSTRKGGEGITVGAVIREFTNASRDPDFDPAEAYTPLEIINLARDVMGRIDLDPASCKVANETVGATRYFDKHLDGLAQEWCGRVWLNPPFDIKRVTAFTEKLIQEVDAGRCVEALLLVNASTGAAWFQELLARFPVTFLRKRLAFRTPSRKQKFQTEIPSYHVIFYAGPHLDRFAAVFGSRGMIALSPEAMQRIQS